MIRIIIAITLSLIGFVCQAQVSENRTVADFTTIEAHSGVEIRYTQSKTTGIKVTSDTADKVQQITTEVEKGVLKIKIKSNKGTNNFEIARVEVLSPNVANFKLASGAKMTLENEVETANVQITLTSGTRLDGNIKSKNVQLDINSGSAFKGAIQTTTLKASLASAGKATITGKATELKVVAKSASVFKAGDLDVKYAIVEAANASKVTVHVTEKLDASASSVAAIEYSGKPKALTTNKNSLGTITAK
ncbi:head GIN domain-containing protein [Flavobacterium sp.]|uniref:head GIN domain-containing protein n=1 Tax=Flavobacterium sp. TaxID=239 RepID=UPI0026125906|nr:head GIN domain-containing protein [Flavobacterium sp.]